MDESTSSAEPAATDDAALAVPELTGKQRKYLRGLAHSLEAGVHSGKSGVTEGVIATTRQMLSAQELVKVRLHEPEDKKADARLLAEATGSALCGLIGHTVILYRPHPQNPKIRLPRVSPAEGE